MADRSYVEPGHQIPSSSIDSKHYAASHTSGQVRATRILVVGATGSGKSTFISHAAGHDVGIGHGADSCTQVCKSYPSRRDIDGTQFELIDTPGFDDPHRNDFEVLRDISESLDGVSGIVYCHRITDTRLIGDSKLTLEIIKAMCGKRFYSRIVICSTMWDTLPQKISQKQLEGYQSRMEQLLSTGFRSLMERGAKYMEFRVDQPEPCLDILKSFSSLRFAPQMTILEQLPQQRSVQETDSGQVIEEEHRRRAKEGGHQQQASAKTRDPEHRDAPRKKHRDSDYDGQDTSHAKGWTKGSISLGNIFSRGQ